MQVPAPGVHVRARHHAALHRHAVRGRARLGRRRGHRSGQRAGRLDRIPAGSGRPDRDGDDRGPPAGDVLPQQEGEVGALHQGEASDVVPRAGLGAAGDRRLVCSLEARHNQVRLLFSDSQRARSGLGSTAHAAGRTFIIVHDIHY